MDLPRIRQPEVVRPGQEGSCVGLRTIPTSDKSTPRDLMRMGTSQGQALTCDSSYLSCSQGATRQDTVHPLGSRAQGRLKRRWVLLCSYFTDEAAEAGM